MEAATPPTSPPAAAGAAPQVLHGEGIHYLSGRVACPLAGVGRRADHDSNRIALAAGTTITVDPVRRRIDVVDRTDYPTRTVVADLTFLAEGITARGARVPFALHLKIEKRDGKVALDFHRHLRTGDELVDADFDAYQVTFDDGRGPRTVLDRDRCLAMVRRPPLMHRVIKAFMAMRERAPVGPFDRPGFAIADLTLGFGLARLGWMLARARLVSLRPADELRGAGLAELVGGGGFELELTALSERWLPEVVKRDLYLFGLDQVPLLAEVRERGLRRGQTMAFRYQDGDGQVRLDDRLAPLPDALDVARNYLEFHMLGGLLVEHASRFVASLTP